MVSLSDNGFPNASKTLPCPGRYGDIGFQPDASSSHPVSLHISGRYFLHFQFLFFLFLFFFEGSLSADGDIFRLLFTIPRSCHGDFSFPIPCLKILLVLIFCLELTCRFPNNIDEAEASGLIYCPMICSTFCKRQKLVAFSNWGKSRLTAPDPWFSPPWEGEPPCLVGIQISVSMPPFSP